MVNKRILLFLTLCVVTIFGYSSIAKATPNNNPIFATIEQVQQMINNAIQHPKAIKVFDKNNQELGIFIENQEYSRYIIFLPNFNRYLKFEITEDNNIKYLNNIGDLYETTDCSGSPYIGIPNYQRSWIDNEIFHFFNRYFILEKTTVLQSMSEKSYNDGEGNCVQTGSPITVEDVYKLTEIPNIYPNPIVFPLQLRYE